MSKVLPALMMLAAASFAVTARADELPKPAKEVAVLEAFIGTWDEEMSNTPTEWLPKAQKSTAVTKRTWYLGGKFLKGEGVWQPLKNEYLHLMTYDPEAKVYRTWYYDAGGTMPRGSMAGVWDAKTKSIIWTGIDEAGNRTGGKHQVIDKDHTVWTMIVTNKEGKVMMEISGKCTRRKE